MALQPVLGVESPEGVEASLGTKNEAVLQLDSVSAFLRLKAQTQSREGVDPSGHRRYLVMSHGSLRAPVDSIKGTSSAGLEREGGGYGLNFIMRYDVLKIEHA